jgi:hypothetical protein
MDVIPIYLEPPILLHRHSDVEVSIVRFEPAMPLVLNLQDSLILCPLLDVHPLLDLPHEVTRPHTPSALVFKPSPRTCLASNLLSPDSVVNLRLSTTGKASREGLTHTLGTRFISGEADLLLNAEH